MADVADYVWSVGGSLVDDVDYRYGAVVDEIHLLNYVWYLASQHPVIFTFAGFVIACLLYLLREWCRVAYAAIEILVGGWALYSSAPVTEPSKLSQAFDQSHFGGFTRVQYLTIIGAIYLVIRGLDNLDKGLQKSAMWNALRAALRIDRR